MNAMMCENSRNPNPQYVFAQFYAAISYPIRDRKDTYVLSAVIKWKLERDLIHIYIDLATLGNN